jgi:hypothetical protein
MVPVNPAINSPSGDDPAATVTETGIDSTRSEVAPSESVQLTFTR